MVAILTNFVASLSLWVDAVSAEVVIGWWKLYLGFGWNHPPRIDTGRGVIQIAFPKFNIKSILKNGMCFFEKNFFSAHRSRFFWGWTKPSYGKCLGNPKKPSWDNPFWFFFGWDLTWSQSVGGLHGYGLGGIGILPGPSRIPFGGGSPGTLRGGHTQVIYHEAWKNCSPWKTELWPNRSVSIPRKAFTLRSE